MSEVQTMAGAILQRLSDQTQTPKYHPVSADLFADWNYQAGDVIQVKSGEKIYNVPLYKTQMKWNGGEGKLSVTASGNQERDKVVDLRRKENNSGAANYSAQKALHNGVGSAQSGVKEINGTLYAAGLQIDPVTGVWLYASEHGDDYALGSSFKVQSDKISLVVEGTTPGDYRIKAASIVASINGSGSQVAISADKILLSGSTYLNGWASGVDAYFSGSATATAMYAFTLYAYTGLYVGTGGTFSFRGSSVGFVSVTDKNGDQHLVLGVY